MNSFPHVFEHFKQFLTEKKIKKNWGGGGILKFTKDNTYLLLGLVLGLNPSSNLLKADRLCPQEYLHENHDYRCTGDFQRLR